MSWSTYCNVQCTCTWECDFSLNMNLMFPYIVHELFVINIILLLVETAKGRQRDLQRRDSYLMWKRVHVRPSGNTWYRLPRYYNIWYLDFPFHTTSLTHATVERSISSFAVANTGIILQLLCTLRKLCIILNYFKITLYHHLTFIKW